MWTRVLSILKSTPPLKRKTSSQLWADSILLSVKLVLHICEVCSPLALHFLPVLSKCVHQKAPNEKQCKGKIIVFYIMLIYVYIDIYIYTFKFWISLPASFLQSAKQSKTAAYNCYPAAKRSKVTAAEGLVVFFFLHQYWIWFVDWKQQ